MGYYIVGKIENKEEYIVFNSIDFSYKSTTIKIIEKALKDGIKIFPLRLNAQGRARLALRGKDRKRTIIEELNNNFEVQGDKVYTAIFYNKEKDLVGLTRYNEGIIWVRLGELSELCKYKYSIYNNIKISKEYISPINLEANDECINTENIRSLLGEIGEAKIEAKRREEEHKKEEDKREAERAAYKAEKEACELKEKCKNEKSTNIKIEPKFTIVNEKVSNTNNTLKISNNTYSNDSEFYKNVLMIMKNYDTITLKKEIFKDFIFLIKKNVDTTISMSRYVSLGILKFDRKQSKSIITLVKFDDSSNDCTIQVLKSYDENDISDFALELILTEYKNNKNNYRYLRV